jgi:hypothetical protein
MAYPYDSCELAVFFDCSKSGSRSIVLALERLFAFLRCPILAASCAAFSMVIQLEGLGREPRFWRASGSATRRPNEAIILRSRCRAEVLPSRSRYRLMQ